MAERITPPDGETIVVNYLASVMPGATVTGWRLGDPAGRAVQVRSTGGTIRDRIVGVPQITLICWGASPDDELGASDLAREAASWMHAAETQGWMGSTPCPAVDTLSLPYPDPDPVTGRARYTATYRPHLRGTATTI